MPPGFKHPNYVCWDNLSAMKQAKLLGYDQTRSHDENPPMPTKTKTAARKKR